MIKRLSLLALTALALTPGTFLRTPVNRGLDAPIALSVVDEPGAQPPPGWSVKGVWEYKGQGLLFGGYSALLAVDQSRMLAFSDRGGRFAFLQPDQPQGPSPMATRTIAEQRVDSLHEMLLFDIESAARDAQTGQYWLAYENTHAFQRYSAQDEGEGVRLIYDEVEWPSNSGAESMVRLADGRFLVIPEDGEGALLYASDPVDGAASEPVAYTAPPGEFSVTDAAQLSDGCIALLLRKVAIGIPPFEARIALADWTPSQNGLVLAPEIVLDLSAVAPPENYEGLTMRARGDGTLDLWVISDDNLSIMQRTLVVKLGFDPAKSNPTASDPAQETPAPKAKPPETSAPKGAKQRARK